ncbi:MAG TPA: glycosyltransferase [Pseudonocardia sp.]|nr:glycosyltransferase [Pseudonocardia sp.]
MIGYYIHHQGSGHLHRALAIQRLSELNITGLSSLPRPSDWIGDWRQLADDAVPEASTEYAAAGFLHYVPQAHDGLRQRMGALSAWITRYQPTAMVVDVSVEVALLSRLHGIPVITLAQPGVRDDRPHTLGYGISDAIIGPWPRVAEQLWQVSDPTVRSRLITVGAISRFTPAPSSEPTPAPERRVVVLNGTGGTSVGALVERAAQSRPDWTWTHLDRESGTWIDDPWPVLRSASVVVSHCGQNAIADIAAARRPAILIPQPRHFGEQDAMAAQLKVLGRRIPAIVLDSWPEPDAWGALLSRAAQLDASRWTLWNDGGGAQRAADALAEITTTRTELSA